MAYRYATTETETIADHAEHLVEECVGYLLSELPDWANGSDSGICCHTCELIIFERPTS